MSRRVFLSYSRHEASEAAWARAELDRNGHTPWFDEHLEGGQEWWDQILGAMQWCEVFIPLLSPNFNRSEACAKELDYAVSLNRLIVPVLAAGDVGKRGQIRQISERQWVDIRRRDPDASGRLVRAVTRLEGAPALPAPLPEPPTVPISYTIGIRQVLGRPELDRPTQDWVLNQVERRWDLGEEPLDLLELLDELGRHGDLLSASNERRKRLHRSISSSMTSSRASSAGPPPPAAPVPPTSPPPVAQPWQVPANQPSSGGGMKFLGWGLLIFVLLFMIGACFDAILTAACDPTLGPC